jgi:NADPH-dependent 2,4-dienoyl-CoA reductase/sulfur reductase-like enzyme
MGPELDDDDEAGPDSSGEFRVPAALLREVPLPDKAEIVIVGAGVIGLSIAYHLARRGLTDVVLVDRGYLAPTPR